MPSLGVSPSKYVEYVDQSYTPNTRYIKSTCSTFDAACYVSMMLSSLQVATCSEDSIILQLFILIQYWHVADKQNAIANTACSIDSGIL